MISLSKGIRYAIKISIEKNIFINYYYHSLILNRLYYMKIIHYLSLSLYIYIYIAEEGPTDMNTLVFRMNVVGKPALPNETQSAIAVAEGDEDIDSTATKVYSSSIEWEPQGSQMERLGNDIRPVHSDILVAKLAPGQAIHVEAHAVKGYGKDHAKFSPVSTATYRLLPSITLSETKPFLNEEADNLVNICPVGVFDIEDLGSKYNYIINNRYSYSFTNCIIIIIRSRKIRN